MAPISGTAPFYDISTSEESGASATLSDFTGAASPSSGVASNTHSDETLQDFYRRGVGLLNISGTQAASGAAAGANGEIVTSGQLSGLANLQRELAARAADIENSGKNAADRLSAVNTILSASGEVQFGG